VHFVQQFAAEVPGVEAKAVDEAALKCLQAYDWPGNVRELKRTIESTLCRVTGLSITVGDLPAEVTRPCGRGGGTFAERVAAAERGILSEALARAEGDDSAAARYLGLPATEFRKLRRKHGL
jgi:DNA-binding NtrC family response regulator